jgi:O-methyltransferase involved in polyketide biosynthesis
MIENKASTTAQGAAMHRAAHQLLDRPLVFEDPLALRIIGSEAEAALHAGRTRYTDPRVARLRAFVAVRSRFTEDCLAAAGVPQYVLLGAGLDTYAYCSDLRRSSSIILRRRTS